MLTIDQRALAVLVYAWRLLPSMKHQALISAVFLEDMGARHGSYGIDDECLGLSTRLFQGENASQILLIDVHGNSPPQAEPFCSRALHTTLHELAHAIGAGTGFDETQEWLGLGGWVKDAKDPEGTGRYWERRPGWGPHGPSPWRYRLNTWFPRLYSTKSPHECFADCVTHIALGWQDVMATPNGRAKLRYLRRELWGERGAVTLAAARERWRGRLGINTARPKRKVTAPEPEEEIEEAVQAWNETQRTQVLASPWTFGDTTAAALALSLAIAPLLLKIYRQAWQGIMIVHEVPGEGPIAPSLDAELAAIHQAAMSYVTTTQEGLQATLAALPTTATPPKVAAAVNEVYDKAARRAAQLAATEAHRAAEEGKLAAWQATGAAQWGVWCVQSATPCGHCLALEGRRVPLGEAFFRKGDVSRDAAGKEMKLDYADVRTPPLHPACRCELEAE